MKLAETIYTQLERVLFELFWSCPATFEIFLSEKNNWNQWQNWKKTSLLFFAFNFLSWY